VASQQVQAAHGSKVISAWAMIAISTGREAMAKITRTNPEGISKPFSNYSHVVTAEAAQDA